VGERPVDEALGVHHPQAERQQAGRGDAPDEVLDAQHPAVSTVLELAARSSGMPGTCLSARLGRYDSRMASVDAYREVVEDAERELARRSPHENLLVARTLRALKPGLATSARRVVDDAALDFERRARATQPSPNSAAS
jgi:hypothetical protein